ncbi:MFS transporter [Chachezhania sediminis]|uniref:MFS transporter n=1 Tax=Chachezhania sediminis TaxID=2599291 RepID=UPI00131E42A9|nr:MFS transporter [Chachezhania sediminis]
MTMSARMVFRSFKGFNYRVWAGGAFISNIGTWVQRTGQDWLVLTQLTQHDARMVGIVMALQFAPQLLLLPWTGFAADHFNQRKMLMVTQGLMGILALGLGALTVLGHVTLWQVCIFAFLFGCVAAFDAPVRQTFVTELVGDDDLQNAVALNSTSFNAGRMIGPAVAGIVIASVGTGWAFLINGFSFVTVLISLAFLRVRELRPNARAARARGSFVEGFRYVWNRPDLRTIMLMLLLIGTFGLNFPIFISTMAVSVFHVDAQGYGLLSSALALGTVSGALLAASRDTPRMDLLIWGAALFGIGCLLAALAPTYWLFAATLVMTGGAVLTFISTANALIQLTTTPAMRGRVMALRMSVTMGSTPIGAPIIGLVATHMGPRWALVFGALSGVAAATVALLAMLRTRKERASESPPPT